MRDGLPPQRLQSGPRSGPGGGRAGRGSNLSPTEGAAEAERRLGLPCFHAGQRVAGLFSCVACQFQIMNRRSLPTCPECGDRVWAYLGGGERPVPEGESPGEAPVVEAAPAPAVVEESVRLEGPVSVQENVKLEP